MEKAFELNRIDLDNSVLVLSLDADMLFWIGQALTVAERNPAARALGFNLLKADNVFKRYLDINDVPQFNDVEVIENGEVLLVENEDQEEVRTG